MKGWQVTASDIKEWTNTRKREAEDTLPLLVRKLIIATVSPSQIIVPAGDSVHSSGWDGVLEVDNGKLFVPCGKSVWEFGTSRDITRKANADFEKRTKSPLGVDRSNTTYVAVTSRPWRRRDDWVAEKNASADWKEVKGLNADDLEVWLEQCPAVHRWFAREIGKRPVGAWDHDQAWCEWRHATSPPCSEELVLAGRESKAEELYKKLEGTPSVIHVRAESSEEAYAFVLAVAQMYPFIGCRLMVVTDPNTWDDLVDSKDPLILLQRKNIDRGYGYAKERGHHVIALDSYLVRGTPTNVIKLGRANNTKLAEALILMGLEERIAKVVVRQSRGSLTLIRRNRALGAQNVQPPDWAMPMEAPSLIPALLAGAWKIDYEQDKEILAKLAGESYSDFELRLHRWVPEEDHPVRLIGAVWQLVSRQDAWHWLSPYVNSTFLGRFGEVLEEVLSETDPRFELPIEERWYSSAMGRSLKHSVVLRRGIAETVALLGAYGDEDCHNVGHLSVRDRVNSWVRKLLSDSNEARWKSLSDLLPQLAEGAPEEFLCAVERGLKGDNPAVKGLFEDQGHLSGCLHAGLLWALESISWNTDLFSRVARVLAKLAHCYPGGRWSNKPSASLKNIFLGLLPQTTLSLDRRLEVLESMVQHEPEAGWHLLLDLLPNPNSGVYSLINKPAYRDWADNWELSVPLNEYHRHNEKVAELTLVYVNENPEQRWPELLEKLPQFPKPLFDIAVVRLSALDREQFSEETRKLITDQLRQIVSQHRQFADAPWALPVEAVDRLEEIRKAFLPEDPVMKHKYLFDKHFPEMPTPYRRLNHDVFLERLEQARQEALSEIWEKGSHVAIEKLARDIETPQILGTALGKASFSEEIAETLYGWLCSENEALSVCARSYVFCKVNHDSDYLNRIKESYLGEWSNETWSGFCLGIPFGRIVFNFLEELGEEVDCLYWEKVRGCILDEKDAEYAEWVLKKLTDHGRPFEAIEAAAWYLRSISKQSGLSSDILASMLEKAAIEIAKQGFKASRPHPSDVAEVINHLQSAGDLDLDRLTQIEWLYIGFFNFNEIEPVTLVDRVLHEPEFFVELVCLAFKPKEPQTEEEGKQLSVEFREQQRTRAYVLLGLVNRIPGQVEGGVDREVLLRWIEKAREGCHERSRVKIGGEQIGKILSYSPVGNDGAWPHEAVRDILETLECEDIERGLKIGRLNQRGASWRVWNEGGKQERELAREYKDMAEKVQDRWPRTAALLKSLADSYEHDAIREDLEVELND